MCLKRKALRRQWVGRYGGLSRRAWRSTYGHLLHHKPWFTSSAGSGSQERQTSHIGTISGVLLGLRAK